MEKIRILFALYAFFVIVSSTIYVAALMALPRYADWVGAGALFVTAAAGLAMLYALGRGE